MTLRKLLLTLHRWLGLTSALIVLIVALTGAVYVWEADLYRLFHPSLYTVEPAGQRLPLIELREAAQAALPGKPLQHAEGEADASAAVIFTYQQVDRKGPGFTYWDEWRAYDKVFVDPYRGTVLGTLDIRTHPVWLTRMLHQNLWLRYRIGSPIVGTATLIFIALIFGGLYLWWPKNKAAAKQRFGVKWGASWRRVNFDAHAVGGLYAALFGLLFATTGLVWTWDWWQTDIYRLLGQTEKPVWNQPVPQRATPAGVIVLEDSLLTDAQARRPIWTSWSLGYPDLDDSTEGFSVNLSFRTGTNGWDESDYFHYHPRTGELYHTLPQEAKTTGQAWRNSNYAIHTGSIYGWPTKVLATLASLLIASLPVTGVLLWWGRRKASKVMRQPAVAKAEAPQPVLVS